MDAVARRRLETEAIVLGYAMSRLDKLYLEEHSYDTWTDAYEHAGSALAVSPASFKNLRDEFDPYHFNQRVGWHHRPLRSDRQRVLDELKDISDEALHELTVRVLNGNKAEIVDAIDSLSVVTGVAAGVAERLLTGRRAEEFFLDHSEQIVHVMSTDIVDLRYSALGFDFGVKGRPETAIEVKGLKHLRGDVQFTDREWSEAKHRRQEYWLVVVGNLAHEPRYRLINDPWSDLKAACSYRSSVTAVWRSRISVDNSA